ncbi:MAG: D-alanyl-D-alanine carboxypeptidase, partial [Paramuribaculum sp.]|nr:D-alanyl-D-alanine carboxypeptidase [Paramuribaculum sp.]
MPGIGADKIAVYIEDLRSGEVLLDVNGEEPMVPASVTKVVTAATLVHKKGMDDRYLSKVIAAGKIDKDGVLNGNIIVKACGDPTIESAYFTEYK